MTIDAMGSQQIQDKSTLNLSEELSEREAVDVMHTAIELYLRDPVAESAAIQAFRALKQIADIRMKP